MHVNSMVSFTRTRTLASIAAVVALLLGAFGCSGSAYEDGEPAGAGGGTQSVGGMAGVGGSSGASGGGAGATVVGGGAGFSVMPGPKKPSTGDCVPFVGPSCPSGKTCVPTWLDNTIGQCEEA